MNYAPMDNSLHSKILPAHLERLAFIYVRQFTQKQVLNNKESQVNQYQLQHRAHALGWPMERIRVIDRDLGQSGSETTN